MKSMSKGAHFWGKGVTVWMHANRDALVRPLWSKGNRWNCLPIDLSPFTSWPRPFGNLGDFMYIDSSLSQILHVLLQFLSHVNSWTVFRALCGAIGQFRWKTQSYLLRTDIFVILPVRYTAKTRVLSGFMKNCNILGCYFNAFICYFWHFPVRCDTCRCIM